MGGWMDRWTNGWQTNLDFILFRLNHMTLLFLFKNDQVLNFTQAVLFEREGY